MLERLHLKHLGPAPELEFHFGPRLNVITGDNGLGKTFALDAAWYALTRTWADDRPLIPVGRGTREDPPSIELTVLGKSGKPVERATKYSFKDQFWPAPSGRPAMPGLTVYARIDGGFSVWDPARNYWRDEQLGADRPSAYQFSKNQIWDGLEEEQSGGSKRTICNGLLRDIETWRLRNDGAFALLQAVLETLSPSPDEQLKLGEGVRVRLDDVRDVPTIRMPYGFVPVTQTAAGIRRILALSYLLVWAWSEHARAAELLREQPTQRVVLLFDEVEAHLHPRWQRMLLPALLRVVTAQLLKGSATSIQVISTTHSPLVLSSLETEWQTDVDQLFDLDLNEERIVELRTVPFEKLGSAENWLSSDVFDLPSAYARAAEEAISSADKFMREHPDPNGVSSAQVNEINQRLRNSLGGDDEYWPLWRPYFEMATGHPKKP